MFAFWIPLILSFYYLCVKPMFAQEINRSYIWTGSLLLRSFFLIKNNLTIENCHNRKYIGEVFNI